MTISTTSSPISSNLEPTARSRDRSPARGRSVAAPERRMTKAPTMSHMQALLRSSALVAVLVIAAAARAKAEDLNDYPTSARADYVFGCMKANGETQELLQKCSCSIDVIASIIPYDHYVAAETIVSMSQVAGPVGSEFRSTEQAKAALQEFRRAQAEAEIRCFCTNSSKTAHQHRFLDWPLILELVFAGVDGFSAEVGSAIGLVV